MFTPALIYSGRAEPIREGVLPTFFEQWSAFLPYYFFCSLLTKLKPLIVSGFPEK